MDETKEIILSIEEVIERLGLGRAEVYRKVKDELALMGIEFPY